MSGLSRTPGKRVWANTHRGFESRPLRQINELRLLNLTSIYLNLPKKMVFTVPNLCQLCQICAKNGGNCEVAIGNG